ncbi:MAG: four helix bundle protein [Chlorobi bacterium]|nr:four helix bundle protein [Chlorobiota bacterium]
MSSNRDLEERLFRFSIDVINFLRTLPNSVDIKVIRYQLIKSATSTGANYEESQAASSKKDFLNKINISLKEIRESNYWLRILKELQIDSDDVVKRLVNESEELKKILGSISVKISKSLNS